MEVPVINRVGDLHTVIGRFPNLISKVLIEQVPQIFSFWKWGALIIAVYAIVNSLLVSFRIQLVRFRNRQSAVTKALLSYTTDDSDYSSDEDDEDDDDDCCSVSSSSVNNDEDEIEEVNEVNDGVFFDSFYSEISGDENDDSMCRFTWSEFLNGKQCVVKLWDGIRLGLDVNNPVLILSTNDDNHSNLLHSLVDTRVGQQPVVTNWTSSGSEKVRVMDLRK